MELMECVRARRSVRRYTCRPVERELIERCLEAARLAPSACNSQPWSFVVLDEPARRDALARRAFAGPYRMNAFAREAPVLIVMITERSRPAATIAGYLKRVRYNLIDIGIAGEHVALAAAALGLGTCWLGWFDERAVKRFLGIGWGRRVDAIISLGYPADLKRPAAERKTLNMIRCYDPS